MEGLPPTHPSGFPREGFQGGGDELGGGGGGWVEAVNVLTTPRTERDQWAEDDVSQREVESSGYLSVSGGLSKDLSEAPLPPPPPLCVLYSCHRLKGPQAPISVHTRRGGYHRFLVSSV